MKLKMDFKAFIALVALAVLFSSIAYFTPWTSSNLETFKEREKLKSTTISFSNSATETQIQKNKSDRRSKDRISVGVRANKSISISERIRQLTDVSRNANANEIETLKHLLDDRKENASVRNEVLNRLRRSSYKAMLADHLSRLLHDPKESEKFRGYCVQHLMYAAEDANDPEARARIIEAIRSVQDDQSTIVRARSMTALTMLGEDDALNLAAQRLLDEKQPVKLGTVTYY